MPDRVERFSSFFSQQIDLKCRLLNQDLGVAKPNRVIVRGLTEYQSQKVAPPKKPPIFSPQSQQPTTLLFYVMDTLDDRSDSTLLLLAAVVVVIVCSASDIPRAYPYRPPVGIPSGNFQLDQLDDEYCRRLMRFTKEKIRTLVCALKIDQVSYRLRLKPPPETAFCLLLMRLSCPQRLFTITQTFHRSETWISTVYNDFCGHLFQ